MTIANPIAQWTEPPSSAAAVTLTRLYWHYDVPTAAWSLTTDLTQSSGQPADLTGTGVFVLTLAALIGVTTPVRKTTRRPDGVIYVA